MFNIKKYFKNRKEYKEKIKKLIENENEVIGKLTLLSKIEEREKIKQSNTPWIEIKSEGLDAEGNITLVLDWNDSFIKQLREAGFKGIRDDELVDHYLYSLFKTSENQYTYSDMKKEQVPE